MEMAQNASKDLGKTLEMQRFPKHASKTSYNNERANSRVQHMECDIEKFSTHIGTCFLGSSQWKK
jgi:hypothetical protein